MRRLWLRPKLAQEIIAHCLEDSPREACGLIGGVGEQAHCVMRVPNIAEDPLDHFRMDERAFVAAMFDLERRGLSLIGLYHSHPRGDHLPSSTDVSQARYPDTAYLVIDLRRGEPVIGGWSIRNFEVLPIPVVVSDIEPAPLPPYGLTPTGRVVVIAAAVLVLIVFLWVSLTLLPPAPPIPGR